MEYRLGKHFFKLAYVKQWMPRYNYPDLLMLLPRLLETFCIHPFILPLIKPSYLQVPITRRHLNLFLQSKEECINRKIKQVCPWKFAFSISC